VRSATKWARFDAWQRGCREALARAEHGEPLAVLIAERRMICRGETWQTGRILSKRDVPMWAVNERWIVCQWGPQHGGRMVPFNRRSGRIALEEWTPRLAWTWVLSPSSLELARGIGSVDLEAL